MSEEEKCETKCFCQNKTFRKIIVISLGTFIGVYSALSLFAAIHKPPMIRPCPIGFGEQTPIAVPYHHNHNHHFKKDFNGSRDSFRKVIKEQQATAPFEEKR